jgi:hypothetical protein
LNAAELIAHLTEGLDEATTAQVKAVFASEKIQGRASLLRQESEYQAIATEQARLKSELEGTGDPDNPGAAAYKQWYAQNFDAIKKNADAVGAYQAKYGTLENPTNPPQNNQPPSMTKADIEKLIGDQLNGNFAPRMSDVTLAMAEVMQQHILNGRKVAINSGELLKLAAKHSGDLRKAYEDYDRPEREKQAAATLEQTIQTRVKEELQKRGANLFYPAGADSTPGPLSVRGSDDKKLNSADMDRLLSETFVSGEYAAN